MPFLCYVRWRIWPKSLVPCSSNIEYLHSTFFLPSFPLFQHGNILSFPLCVFRVRFFHCLSSSFFHLVSISSASSKYLIIELYFSRGLCTHSHSIDVCLYDWRYMRNEMVCVMNASAHILYTPKPIPW